MKALTFLSCFLVLVAICGCGSSNTSTAKVTGIVTHNGAAVDGATVVFGAASDEGHVASGTTDSAGKFLLTTFEPDDGAVPGSYTVAISKRETSGGMSEDEEHEAINAGKKVTEAVTTELLPKKYGTGPTSGLTAEVTAAGPNDFPFELTE